MILVTLPVCPGARFACPGAHFVIMLVVFLSFFFEGRVSFSGSLFDAKRGFLNDSCDF